MFADEDEGYTKVFLFVFQDCQSLRNFISSLIGVTVGNDVTELDVKSCS